MQTNLTPGAGAFTLALLGMGLFFLLYPRAAPWLGAALVLGALMANEEAARTAGIAGPIAELRGVVAGAPVR